MQGQNLLLSLFESQLLVSHKFSAFLRFFVFLGILTSSSFCGAKKITVAKQRYVLISLLEFLMLFILLEIP